MSTGGNDLAPKVSKFLRVTRIEKLVLAKSGFGGRQGAFDVQNIFPNFSELC